MSPPIADYALLGDCQGAALAARDGSIDWWCAPRFDSRSTFARLLDPAAGHWSIRPVGDFEVTREYVAGTLVLETMFTTSEGSARLTDALSLAPGAREHEIGQDSPHALVRRIEVLEGEMTVAFELCPRLEYGLVTPTLVRNHTGAIETIGGPDTLLLVGDADGLDVEHGVAAGELLLGPGERAGFSLHHREGVLAHDHEMLDPAKAIDDTIAGWRSWSEPHDVYDGAYRDEVKRSTIVLKALTYQPSGALVAAPTTSLPEIVGGSWNWDYRYAWLRDASLTLRALEVSACPHEPARYFDWMARAATGAAQRGHVQIMFGVEGERDLTERELPHLEGYRQSTPVRVGNDAWRQRQLDVYGEVLDAAWALRERLGDMEPHTAAFLCELADRAADTWGETDAGIWEGREGERHYLSSKLMCWVALDRAVRLADHLGPNADPNRWAGERDAVRAEIESRGWSEEAGAYTGAFGSHHHDASVLLMPLMDFAPPDDERMRQTVAVIERELSHGGLVRRWTGAEEGGFVICSYWLAEALAREGEIERARAVFDGVSAYLNDVGLLAEEVDPERGELIGNFPQAFSHVGLINAAWGIERAESAVREGAGAGLR